MRFLTALVCLVLSWSAAVGQSPNSWREIVLDESVLVDVTAALGGAGNHKFNQKLLTPIDGLVHDNRRFLRVEFKNQEGLKKVAFYFSAGRVRAIELTLDESINPNSLSDAYGVDFSPRVTGLKQSSSSADQNRSHDARDPQEYPPQYSILGASESAFVVASIDNSERIDLPAEIEGIFFPGRTRLIQLISRKTHGARGLDVLR